MLLLSSALLVLSLVQPSNTCGAGGGSGADYEYIRDPTFKFNVSPPVAWTFFPPTASDNQVVWYFVGQSNNSAQATQQGNAQLTASIINAMAQANLPLQGVEIAPQFTPISVQNPGTLVSGTGPLYGRVEASALTQTAPGGGTAFVWSPYSQVVTVRITGTGTTRYNWKLVSNTFMQQMTLNYGARFTNEIEITGTTSG